MPVKRLFVGSVLGLLLLLVGCGVTPQAGVNPGQGTPNTTAGTVTAGPLPIATDHSTYAPTDAMQVTLTNQMALPIYVTDHQASCSIFAIETQVNGVWQDLAPGNSRLAGCPLESPTRTFALASGATYQASIKAGFLRQGDARFPDGHYRLRLSYATAPPKVGDAQALNQVVYSATLTIASNITPQPIPTLPPAGSGTGTATAGTVVPVKTTTP